MAALVVLAASLMLAACGDEGSSPARTGTDPDSTAVEIVDHLDRTVRLEEPATRVVALEWEAVENVLALGVDPVGVGDGAIYRNWVAAGEDLPEDTVSVGSRSAPSIEKIAALRPDLIVTGRLTDETHLDQFEEIAPVAIFDVAPQPGSGDTEWDRMESEVERLGTLLGREERAEELLASMEESLRAQAARLRDAGVAGQRVALVQAYTAGKPTARLFDDRALLVEVLERMGLENAYDGEPKQWGITTVGFEGLRAVANADWMLTMALPGDDPFEEVWAQKPAFRAFPVVKADRVVPLGGDTWPWGGPLSITLAAERFADALTGETKPY